MQLALIYDSGRRGQELVQKLISRFGEPENHNTEGGEVLWKDQKQEMINFILETQNIGDVILMLFVGGDEEDMTQFLSI